MKKINYLGTLLTFALTFGLINWYEVLRGTQNITIVDEAMFKDMNFSLALIVGTLAALLVAIITYKTDKRYDHELLRDFVLTKLNDSEKSSLEGLSDYDRNCFYSAYKESFSEEMNEEYESYISECNRKKSKVRKTKRISCTIVILAICMMLTPVYQDYVSAQELYNQQVAQAEAEAEQLRLQQEAEYNTIMEDQILYYDGLPPINLVSGSTFKKGDVEKYINDYVRTQPQFLLNDCAMINLCTDEQFINFCNVMGMSTSLGDFGETYAFAHSSNMNIYVRLNLDEDTGVEWEKHTVTHELSHIYDYTHGNISNGYAWQNLYNQYGSSITDYSTYSAAECFADAAAMYVESPDELKEKSMDIYNFINGYYQMY